MNGFPPRGNNFPPLTKKSNPGFFHCGTQNNDQTLPRTMPDKRVTMIKPVVGKVKSPSYALPDDDFVYGIESKLDKENAGEGEKSMNHLFTSSINKIINSL